MTTTVSFPSEQFPAYPAISVEAPEGWTPIVVPGMVLALGRTPEPDVFRANVVVAVSRFPAGYELSTASKSVVEKFASLADAHEIGRDTATIDGVEWFHIESTFSDPRVGTLVQSAHLSIVDHGSVVDLVQVTGTVTGTQAHENGLGEVREIQRSATARVL